MMPAKTPPCFFWVDFFLKTSVFQQPKPGELRTHCGFGGLNETIAAGKPMVALPFRADQPANAKLAKERGLAEVLEPKTLGWSSRQRCHAAIWGKFGKSSTWLSAGLKKGDMCFSQEGIYITYNPPEFTKMLIVLQNHIHTYTIYLYTDPMVQFYETRAATQKCGLAFARKMTFSSAWTDLFHQGERAKFRKKHVYHRLVKK